jgi:hypothetical protein
MMAAGAAILIAPFLVDYVQWSLWRQRLQQDADGAAIMAARAIDRGEPARPAVERRLYGVRLAAPPRVETPLRDGHYAGLPGAVRVSITALRSTLFHGSLFGPSPMHVRAAAARIAYRGGPSIIVRVE